MPSLSFKVEDKPIIIVVAGDAKVDNSRYKAQFHTKAKMLTHEEAHELIGHDVGGVCPFALPEDVKVYLDVSMKRFETVFPRRRQQQQRRGDDLRRAGAVRLQLCRVGGCVQGLAARGAGMIRFLHGADFHLDSAFGALPPGQAAARRRESRELALRLADYVKEHGIDLVLLAGDLFDSASPLPGDGGTAGRRSGTDAGQGVHLPGNHDWYGPGSPWETVDWPENVYVFKENRLTAVEVPERNLVIHGAAFSGPEQPESLLAGFTAPADGKCHIGLLHGELDGAEARYGPIRREEAAASGPAIWHWATSTADGAPDTGADGLRLARLSGGPGGSTSWGRKGVYEGTISDGGEVSLTFVPFARHRYEVLEVDVTGKEPPGRRGGSSAAGDGRGTCTASSSPARPERAWRWRRGHPGGAGGLVLRPGGPGPHPHGGGPVAAGGGGLPPGPVSPGASQRRKQAETEAERAEIDLAARFGLAALDHRDLG